MRFVLFHAFSLFLRVPGARLGVSLLAVFTIISTIVLLVAEKNQSLYIVYWNITLYPSSVRHKGTFVLRYLPYIGTLFSKPMSFCCLQAGRSVIFIIIALGGLNIPSSWNSAARSNNFVTYSRGESEFISSIIVYCLLSSS